ncbi:hypothetical protein BCV71DRAFT_241131 [Rhizopus microsporus]|uniref:Amino acid permease/ SLC12A domain-containing protein n=1 Tax=Rhizopus microsporus TaxID=58291 RepID=A0A1X0SDZ6_RHIZD|nr:hypothetical protein BCV71DRAFT_241131 [Rhizopus microsporus]
MSNKHSIEQESDIKAHHGAEKPPPEYEIEKMDSSSYHSKRSKNAIGDEEDLESLQHGTHRGLDARHIQMISLGGAIGTGLFLSSGSSIAEAGPAGALIAYCVGEMATFMPVSGSFNHYATRFVEPSLGFALGWNYWFSAVTIATELAAAATIIKFWGQIMPDPAWSTIFLVLIVAVNFMGVRIYGELEYWFALIKILIVIVFIIIGILVAAGAVGGHVIGFEYWKNPGAFNNGAVGTISVLLSAGFSFQGTEIVGITAGEAKNPTKTVPRAIRNTFWRIIVFYICTIFLIGMCIPYNDEGLTNPDGGAGTASFTLIFQAAGIDVGAHIINAIVLTSVLSAANSSLYTTSRTLLGLARDGNAPAFLGRVNKYGAPFCADKAFVWFQNITAVSGFISWAGIGGVHIRFRRAYVRQGRSIAELPYTAMAYPFSGLFSCILSILIVLGQGYDAFTPQFDAVQFCTKYVGIVPFILCYVIHKVVTRKKLVALEEVDFETGRVTRFDIEKDAEVDEHIPRWRRFFNFIA